MCPVIGSYTVTKLVVTISRCQKTNVSQREFWLRSENSGYTARNLAAIPRILAVTETRIEKKKRNSI